MEHEVAALFFAAVRGQVGTQLAAYFVGAAYNLLSAAKLQRSAA